MTERNEIHNAPLKDQIANAALSILLDNKELSNADLPGLGLQFGYLFATEQGMLEALLKLSLKEGRTFYFAVQKNKLMYLPALDEAKYQLYVETMPEHHPCLRQAQPSETEAQRLRKQENLAFLRANHVACSDLPCRCEDSQVRVKGLEEIRRRAVAAFIAIQTACDINNGAYEDAKAYFAPLLEREELRSALSEKEQRITANSGTAQDVLDAAWSYECYWVLCWYLGLVDEIRDASEICDCQKAISLFPIFLSPQEFQAKAAPRSVKELLDLEDLYFRYHWAILNRYANPDTEIGALNPSVVIERRRALEWLLSPESDWDLVDLSA